MKNIAKVLSIVVFGLSVGVANASSNSSDNVQKTKSYQENVVAHATTASQETKKATAWEESSWNGFQKADEAD